MTKSSILFATDLDGTLLQSDGTISSYSKQILNQLTKDGALITAATGRSGATAAPLFAGIELNLPLITLNGSALFSIQEQAFYQCQLIPYSISKEILSVFRKYRTNCLTYTITDQQIQIYYDRFQNPAEQDYYEQRRKLHFKTYFAQDLPKNQDTVYFSAIQPISVIRQIEDELKKAPFASKINMIRYDDIYHTGYHFFEVYAGTASKKNAVLSLAKQCQANTVIVFGDNMNDQSMMEAADRCFAVGNAAEPIKQIADEIIGDHNEDSVVKKIAEIFYTNS